MPEPQIPLSNRKDVVRNDESWSGSSLHPLIEEFNELLEKAGNVRAGLPPAHESGWFPFEQLASRGCGERVIRRIARDTNATWLAAATYTFRYATYYPLLLAGYLFARERRVPVLSGNTLLADLEWLNHIRLLEPRFIVLSDTPAVDEMDSPTDSTERRLGSALINEVSRFVGTLIDAWAAQKWVARANAWATTLDSLASGFQLAGRHAVGPDLAWASWERLIEGRVFPVRRRPRRFLFTVDGVTDELLVRSGCCLWFTQEAAKNGPAHYCTSCYLEEDDKRFEQIAASKRKQKMNV